MAINVYIMTLTATEPHQCFLVLGDNTSGLGWMIKSSHLTTNSPYFFVVGFIARKISSLLMHHGHCLARQHIRGNLNVVPDYLSYTGHQRVKEKKGITKRLTLHDIVFRDYRGAEIPHDHPHLRFAAVSVTLCFQQQKNREQRDRRTQHRTGDRILCPVLRFIDVVTHIWETVPGATPSTTLCTTTDDTLRPMLIDNNFTLTYLRSTCLDFGGTTTFGFHPLEIGNKSIRSGAAMALFMAKQLPERIMIIGRWKSIAFLDYIRPQVLQWTHHMAKDMIQFDHFFDINPTSALRPLHDTDNGRPIEIPGLNVNYDRSGLNVNYARQISDSQWLGNCGGRPDIHIQMGSGLSH